MPYVARSFVFGAAPAGARVTVNGRPALSTSDGAWIAYVPLRAGAVRLRVSARTRAGALAAERDIEVAAPLSTTPATPARIDPAQAPLPAQDLVVRPGETVHLAIKASASAIVKASIGGAVSAAPLAEASVAPSLSSEKERALGQSAAAANSVGGIYSGDVTLPLTARGMLGPVKYTVSAADGTTSEAFSKGSISVDDSPTLRVGRLVLRPAPDASVGQQPYGIVQTAPRGGWLFFPLAGTPFALTGRSGDYYRVALGSQQQGWIAKRYLELLPEGTPLPRADVGEITVHDAPTAIHVAVALSARVPFRIDQTGDGANLLLRFYGAQAATDYISYQQDRAPLRYIRWDQAPGDIATVEIALRQHALWGYRFAWRGAGLDLQIKKPPRFAAAPASALTHLLVVIDPGHSPDLGAVGPLGVAERDVNLAIAKRLAAHLHASGARTVLTRYSSAAVSLYERPALARRLNADVLVSVHNNALPDGIDPATHHGSSVYYYQPQSLALARALHAAYARMSGLPDYGLYFDNLALARPTEEPAVLTESAFIMWPPEEALLLNPRFQDRLGATLARGLQDWAAQMRAAEAVPHQALNARRPSPAAASAARHAGPPRTPRSS